MNLMNRCVAAHPWRAKGKKQDENVPPETAPDLEMPSSPFSLAPSRWLVMMDIGREKGTWMPQSWGRSGRYVHGSRSKGNRLKPCDRVYMPNVRSASVQKMCCPKDTKSLLNLTHPPLPLYRPHPCLDRIFRKRRVEVDLLVQFLPRGDMKADVDSPFVDMTVTPGKWSVGAAQGKPRRRPMNSLGETSAVGLGVARAYNRAWASGMFGVLTAMDRRIDFSNRKPDVGHLPVLGGDGRVRQGRCDDSCWPDLFRRAGMGW